jgi:Sulfotransferase family
MPSETSEVSFPRPDWVRRINAMAPGVGGAAALVALDPDALLAHAVAATGLDDFGDSEWEAPYRRLVESLETEARLTVVGRLLCRHDLLRHLCTRLVLVDTHRRNPALAATPVPAPIFITGPARSGTSILQELLALDPALRAPLGYEMAYPVVASDVDDATRRAWAECEFDLWADVHPGFAAVHSLEAALPEECLWLVAPQFDHGFWTTNTNTPSFTAFRAMTDPAPVYECHRRFVQVLQGGQPASWVFKSPMHLGRLPALLAVYPDARILRTHRDPVKTMPSSVSTLVHGRWTRSDHVVPADIASSVVFGFTLMLNGIAAPEAALPVGQVAELHYLDLLRDPVDAIAGAYDTLGLTMAEDVPDRVRAYLAARPQGHAGTHRYSLEEYGLDRATIRADLAPYLEAFAVEPEA